jgi:hypothetical protein
MPDYGLFMFSHPEHLRLQGGDLQGFYLVRKVNQKIMAQVVFHVRGQKAVTPLRAPFGSFLYSEHLSPQTLYEFIQYCEVSLRAKGITSVTIGEPPLFYRKSGDLIHTILLNLNYLVSKAELSSGIRIDHINFEEKIQPWEKRKLKQAKDKGLHFRTIPVSELGIVYAMILKCREQRGHALSMTLDDLARTVDFFKESFFLFGAFLHKDLAAASVAIRVSPGILYNFYSGHLRKYDSISPMVMLTGGMYKFCGSHQIQLLDLGTSSLNGQPNFSLLDFKLRLGGVPSMKVTFEKALS